MAGMRGRILGVALALGALAVVAATIGLDPPARQRARSLDARREADLNALEIAIREHARRHGDLPADLAVLAAEPGFRAPSGDPQSGAPYGYEIVSTSGYRLCADFSTDTKADPGPGTPAVTTGWAHAAGRQCFERTIKER